MLKQVNHAATSGSRNTDPKYRSIAEAAAGNRQRKASRSKNLTITTGIMVGE